LKRGTPEHPKVSELMSQLSIPRYSAIGLLEALWHFTAEYAPQGDIGKHSDRAIALACYWHGEPGRFVKALVAARLLSESAEHRLLVWDWADHADDYTRKKLQRKGLTIFVVQKCPDNSRLPVPVPKPVPEPRAVPAPVRTNGHPADTPPAPPGFALDELYASFRSACAWLQLIPSDFLGDAWREWRALDAEQQFAAVAGIQALEKAGADPALVKRPKRYLHDREWLRPPPKPPKSKIDKMMDDAMRLP